VIVSGEISSTYEASGFVAIHDLFSAAEVDELRLALEIAINPSGPPQKHSTVVKQGINLWIRSQRIKKCVLDPRLALIARALIGSSEVRLWHDQALIKLPGSGESPWHQDLPFWPVGSTELTSCWIALDHVDENNGCLEFIPGSHRYGAVPIYQQPVAKSVLQSRSASVLCAPVPVRLQAGSCTFHHGLVLHHAPANKTERPRRALKIIYMRSGMRYAPKQHAVTAALNLSEGETLDDPDRFPLIPLP